MLDTDDMPPARLPDLRAGTATAFGRRAVAGQRVAAGPRRPRGGTKPAAQPLVVRYKRSVALVGTGLMSVALKLLMFSKSAGGSQATPAHGLPFDLDGPGGQFVIAALLAALIGLGWLYQGLMRTTALSVDGSGMKGFTLLGSRHFAWADIERIEVNWHSFYKRQIIIHAVRGSPTGGWGIISPTQIPIMTAKVDRSVDAIIAAVRQYRPDLPFERNENPTLVAILEFLMRFTKLWRA